ncbi:transposase [Candidatus Parcubacteria bacterium]|nr:transposase [Candidatus Parcubacteria bacterium]
MKKYKDKKQYRRKGYDYSQNGYYFVTICAKNREIFFGDIAGEKMILSEIGQIADKFWREIPNRFSIAQIDEYVVMPNHVHGIIIIENNRRNAPRRVLVNNKQISKINKSTITTNLPSHIGKTAPTVEQNAPRRVPTGIQPLVKNSLSSILNHYKGNVKKYCNKNNLECFTWQSRFHDRIIRNENELNRIRQYMTNNPLRWELDRNNQENLYM